MNEKKWVRFHKHASSKGNTTCLNKKIARRWYVQTIYCYIRRINETNKCIFSVYQTREHLGSNSMQQRNKKLKRHQLYNVITELYSL